MVGWTQEVTHKIKNLNSIIYLINILPHCGLNTSLNVLFKPGLSEFKNTLAYRNFLTIV